MLCGGNGSILLANISYRFFVFLITKIVSISSMLASLMLIVSYFILGIKDIPLLVMISLMFVLIVYKHRSNIMRLIKGKENKIDFSKKEK